MSVRFNTSEYGFVFIKSGFESVQDGLTSDFSDNGIEVVEASPVIMKPEVVGYIYRHSCQEPFYPTMFRYLVKEPVIAMALHSGAGQDVQATLNDLKRGTGGRPCLREKYLDDRRLIPEDEIDAWYRGTHPNQNEVTIRLTQGNVFHAADTSYEAVKSLCLLSRHNPEFWAATREDDPRIRNLAGYLTKICCELC